MSNSKDDVVRSEHLHDMFTSIPPRYDLTNHLITLGLDWRWRRKAVRECLSGLPGKMLDLCCGTGDLIIRVAQKAQGNVELTGLDFSQPMLEIAARKAEEFGVGGKVSFIYADATKMPFPDDYFDCVGISFAFRNLTYKNPSAPQYLSEVFRALKVGGRFVIVETSQPRWKIIRALNHFYVRLIAQRVGYFLSGDRGAYRYLTESSTNFFAPDEVRDMLLKSGFSEVRYRPLFFGAAGIHMAVK